jgi:hypothetical protein
MIVGFVGSGGGISFAEVAQLEGTSTDFLCRGYQGLRVAWLKGKSTDIGYMAFTDDLSKVDSIVNVDVILYRYSYETTIAIHSCSAWGFGEWYFVPLATPDAEAIISILNGLS